MSENCRKCAGRLVAAKLQTLRNMARPGRFERPTAWFVARYSIQLSYGRVEGRYYREQAVLSQGLGSADRPLQMVTSWPLETARKPRFSWTSASHNTPGGSAAGGGINQHPRVHHPMGVQHLAGAGEGLPKQGR